MAGSVTVTGVQTGTPEGGRLVAFTIPLGSVEETLPVSLASGSNTIPVPAGATLLIIIPPAGNAVTLSVNGVSASPSSPYVMTFGTTPASIAVVAGSAIAAATLFYFF